MAQQSATQDPTELVGKLFACGNRRGNAAREGPIAGGVVGESRQGAFNAVADARGPVSSLSRRAMSQDNVETVRRRRRRTAGGGS
jgi:hypothetical protein